MTDFPINTDADVLPALNKAHPGDTLTFAAGVYGAIRLSGKRWPAPGVTLRPASGAKVTIRSQRVGAGPFLLDGIAGLTIEGFELDTFDGVGVMMGGVNPERIVIRRCEIHGAIVEIEAIPTKGGIAVAFGNNAVDCAMENCEVHHTGGGVNGSGGSGNRIVGNRFHHIGTDAMHFAPGSNLLIEGNEVRDIYSQFLAHLDGIQITTVGVSAPPQGIVIRRNRLIRGAGTPFQGIFGNNEAGLPYRGLVIEENLVASGAYHGITMRMAEGPIIRNNYVTGDAGSLDGKTVMNPWIKVMESTDAVVTDNFCVSGPILFKTTIKDQKGNKNIRLPSAGDYAAAEAWWAKLAPRPQARLTHLEARLAELTATVGVTKAMLLMSGTRRTALAQMLAQASML